MGRQCLNEYNLCVGISCVKLAMQEPGRTKNRPARPITTINHWCCESGDDISESQDGEVNLTCFPDA